MKSKILLTLFLFVLLFCGCGGDATTTNSTANSASRQNSNSSAANANAATNVANAAANNATSADAKLPPFPFPPNASAEYDMPAALVNNPNGQTTFGDVDDKLSSALATSGYEKKAYYSVDSRNGGFAVATAAEQITAKGEPTATNRFNIEKNALPPLFSKEYWENALRGRTGYFRVIAFMITDINRPIGNGTTLTLPQAQSFTEKGGLAYLPEEIRKLPFTGAHRCTALVYEFRKDRSSGEIKFQKVNEIPVQSHLRHIIDALKKEVKK